MLTEVQKFLVGLWILPFLIAGGMLGHDNSTGTKVGGTIVGALSFAFGAFIFIGFLSPKLFRRIIAHKVESRLELILAPAGGIIGALILINYGNFFKFLINEEFWDWVFFCVLIVGLLALIRLILNELLLQIKQ